jgi:hypothetical protein
MQVTVPHLFGELKLINIKGLSGLSKASRKDEPSTEAVLKSLLLSRFPIPTSYMVKAIFKEVEKWILHLYGR